MKIITLKQRLIGNITILNRLQNRFFYFFLIQNNGIMISFPPADSLIRQLGKPFSFYQVNQFINYFSLFFFSRFVFSVGYFTSNGRFQFAHNLFFVKPEPFSEVISAYAQHSLQKTAQKRIRQFKFKFPKTEKKNVVDY